MDGFWFRESSFEVPLKYEPLDSTREGRKEYRLTEGFSFEIGGFGSKTYIKVPAGFVTDLASMPKFIRGILPPNGPYAKAAVIHDYMYEFAGEYRWTRSYADFVFKEGMERLKVPALTRFVMYRAVRMFGNKNFDKVSKSNRQDVHNSRKR